MTVSVKIAQFKSFGSQGRGDAGGGAAQVPNELAVPYQTLSVTTGSTVDLDPATTIVKIKPVDGAVLINFNGDIADIDTVSDHLSEGEVYYQGVVQANGDRHITAINLKEVS